MEPFQHEKLTNSFSTGAKSSGGIRVDGGGSFWTTDIKPLIRYAVLVSKLAADAAALAMQNRTLGSLRVGVKQEIGEALDRGLQECKDDIDVASTVWHQS